jgi:hypothetical protein
VGIDERFNQRDTMKQRKMSLYRIDIFSSDNVFLPEDLPEKSDAWIVLAADENDACLLLKNQYKRIEKKMGEFVVQELNISKSSPGILLGSFS